MNGAKLNEQTLGLEAPWSVRKMTLRRKAGEIEIEVTCAEKIWACPECGQRMHGHGSERRRWRHLVSCQFKTFMMA